MTSAIDAPNAYAALPRRAWLGAIAAALLGCGGATPAPKEAPLPPLSTDKLEALATSAGLVWMVRAKPRAIAAIPWLIPAIGKIVPESSFDTFRRRVGFDPRQVTEALLLRYGPLFGDCDLQLVRHNESAAGLEKLFLSRLSKDPARAEDRPDVVRISGMIGRSKHSLARIGRDVAAFQEGGDLERGPLRVATLLAQGKLPKAPRLSSEADPLGALLPRFGEAPVIVGAVGPFQDEWRRAAHGLLEVATAVAGAARPTAREHIGLAIAIAGDFGDDGAKAGELLRASWDDLAATSLGGILGLDRTIEAPVAAGDAKVATLSVELEPNRLAEGLHALVTEDLEAIMKLD